MSQCECCGDPLPQGRLKYCSEECKRSEQNHRNYQRRKLRSAAPEQPAQPAPFTPQPQSPLFYRPNPNNNGGQLRLGDALDWIDCPQLVAVVKTETGFMVVRAEDVRAASRDPQEVVVGHHHPDGNPIPPYVRLAQRAAFVMNIQHHRKYTYSIDAGAIIVRTIAD